MLNVATPLAQQIDWLLAEQPKYLVSFPSNLAALAEHCLERGIALPGLEEVRTIGDKLAASATEYLRANKAGDRVENFEWEFNVVSDESINAWAMPGGKMVVYSGLIERLRLSDSELAATVLRNAQSQPSCASRKPRNCQRASG